MTDKAYIVANEQQEREVLEKLEQEGMVWFGDKKPTEWVPSSSSFAEFPYVLFKSNKISWIGSIGNLSDEKIVYDGRKEDTMSEKYVVSQKFMTELEEWKDTLESNDDEYEHFVGIDKLTILPDVVFVWRYIDNVKERNNRLIAIIRWVNGEDVFEVDNPKKWVVRSLETDDDGDYRYVLAGKNGITLNTCRLSNATRFDTKKEAESWTNSHQEVIEVEE